MQNMKRRDLRMGGCTGMKDGLTLGWKGLISLKLGEGSHYIKG